MLGHERASRNDVLMLTIMAFNDSLSLLRLQSRFPVCTPRHIYSSKLDVLRIRSAICFRYVVVLLINLLWLFAVTQAEHHRSSDAGRIAEDLSFGAPWTMVELSL